MIQQIVCVWLVTACGPEVGDWGLWALQQFYSVLLQTNKKNYLFLAVLTLCCCTGFSPAAGCGLLLLLSPGSRVSGLQWLQQVGSGAPLGSRAQAQQLWCTGLSWSVACGIFKDQGWNLCLLHRQADTLRLSHQGSPILSFFNLLFFSASSLIEKWQNCSIFKVYSLIYIYTVRRFSLPS